MTEWRDVDANPISRSGQRLQEAFDEVSPSVHPRYFVVPNEPHTNSRSGFISASTRKCGRPVRSFTVVAVKSMPRFW